MLRCVQVERGIDKVQELIDNPYLLKSAAFMLIDALLVELFPELTGKLAGDRGFDLAPGGPAIPPPPKETEERVST